MVDGYKIVITGKNIYREYTISDENDKMVNIGTERNCHIRFREELFFEEFSFRVQKENGEWVLVGNEKIYFTTDGVMKLKNKKLVHGDEVEIKFTKYNQSIFKLNFFIDFDSVEKEYNREINLEHKNKIIIGGSENSHILIKDELVERDTILIYKEKENYYLKDLDTRYGVYLNTEKISEARVIREMDFIIFAGYYFYFKNNKLYTDINDKMIIQKLEFLDFRAINKFKYPKFNRNSRVKYKKPEVEIEILSPEKMKEKPKTNLIMTLIPALVMLMLTVAIRGKSGGSFVIFSIATMTMGMIMSVVTVIYDKKTWKKELEERKENYLKYITQKETLINEIRSKELEVDKKIYLGVEEIVKNIKKFDKELFDKDVKDEDFLSIRLGKGRKRAGCEIKVTKQEFKDTKDELVDLPEKIKEKYEYIDDISINVDLKEMNALGIVGKYSNIKDFINSITLDLVGRHFYKDVKLFYMIKEDDAEAFSWLRWIKHLTNEELDIKNIICDEESKNILFEYLYVELNRRISKREKKSDEYLTKFIIIVLDKKGIYNHPISRFIEYGKELNVTFVFCEEGEELLPKGCDKIVRLKNENTGTLVECSNGEEYYDFKFENTKKYNLEKLAIGLSPITTDEVSLEGELTKNISLYQLLNIKVIDDLNLKERWEKSIVYKSMAAPLGVKIKNEIVCLDLNEKHHGPHGLVAGTTGSGKSEILQSYILSMATLFNPTEVGFVIIDFKGGGMVNQFKDLPHLVGAITNIDGKEITRSLLSIKAELRKRQEAFSEANVNHVDAYIKLYKEGKVSMPLPHLILIVDEFAELKSDQPEFMKELISAARIGRSLGVHLILATQKPSGVVDDQIWSNSKFKLCLKVQNQNDSKEVLKSPLAAEIKEPGRAYLQVGNNEIFELFQSAYSGAPALVDDSENIKEFEINEVNLWGKRKNIFKQKKKKSSKKMETQLDVLVQYVKEYCNNNNIVEVPGICLPPLPDMIFYEDLELNKTKTLDIEVDLGLFDDPTRQLQDVGKVNLSEGNLFIVGSPQFGKTGVLQTIIRGLAEKFTPKEVNIYILDFASMILKNFENLAQVGGVIVSSDDEKLKTYFKMMLEEIEKRKERLASIGISSFTSYKEAGYTDLPHIVMIMDNITAFKELFQDREEEYLKMCRECVTVGITLVVANNGTNGIGYKYMSNFANKIALYCNDAGEYSSIFDRCRMQPKNVPGRGLIDINKVIYEYQTVLSFKGEKEIDRVKAMKMFIEEINIKAIGMKAKKIPEIPKVLNIEYMKENNIIPLKNNEVFFGLEFETIGEIKVNLAEAGVISLIGKEGKGKKNFIKCILDQLEETALENPVELYVVDDFDKGLAFAEDYGFTNEYSVIYSDLTTYIEEITEILEERNNRLNSEGKEVLEDEPLIVLVNNNIEALMTLGTNTIAMKKYEDIINKYKKLKVAIILNNIPNAPVSYGSNPILKAIKESKTGIMFDNINEVKIFDYNMTAARAFKNKLKKNEVYIFTENGIEKAKLLECANVLINV